MSRARHCPQFRLECIGVIAEGSALGAFSNVASLAGKIFSTELDAGPCLVSVIPPQHQRRVLEELLEVHVERGEQ
jgi:hypothetical protein